jgi:hypothetical protein
LIMVGDDAVAEHDALAGLELDLQTHRGLLPVRINAFPLRLTEA